MRTRDLLDVTMLGVGTSNIARMRARLQFIQENLDRFERDQNMGSPFAGHVPIAAVRRWLAGAPYVG